MDAMDIMDEMDSPIMKLHTTQSLRQSLSLGAALFLSGMTLFAKTESSSPQSLQAAFEQPSETAKPRTWWHWVSGNVSGEGIKADLRAMKSIGLAGAQLFTVDQSAVQGPVKFMSPEWRQLVGLALGEAGKLGLEMSIEGCEGWSESGGPWIKPEQGMQQIVWSEAKVNGGSKIALNLPQPPATRGFYRDIALFAFPTLKGDQLSGAKAIKTSLAGTDLSPVLSGTAEVRLSKKKKEPFWIDLFYDQPITASSLIIDASSISPLGGGELQTSQDGSHFAKLGAISLGGVSSFPAVTGTYFRLFFPKIDADQIPLREIDLAGPRIEQLAALTAMQPRLNIPFTQSEFPAQETIDPAAIVDLTGKTEWEVPPGNWTLVRMGHTGTGATTHPAADPGLECDKLDPATVRYHFEQMYRPVFEQAAAHGGGAFRYLLLDSWEAGCANWTAHMPEEFAKRRGYDLKPWLPVFTGRVVKDWEQTQRFLWDFRRTVADLVTDYHYGIAQQFAHEHHLGLYAEAPGIGLPTVADNLACKGRTDIPMGEFWVNRKNEDNIDDPKEAASAAHLYGQNIAAAESYTATANVAAWANDPYGLKALGDMEFCLGINRFVFHRYAHQPWLDRQPGMSMGPWGINFERTNTWWNQGAAWMQYISRCQALLQRGRFVADLLYFCGEGAPAAVSHRNLKPAVPAGFDYDVCNAELLLGQASCDQGEIVFKNSGMRYRMLVLPDTDRMTLPILQKIRDLVAAGAMVYGPKPASSPSLSGPADADTQLRQIAQELWADADGVQVTSHSVGKGKILWGQPLATALQIPADFAASQPDVLFIHRKSSEGQATSEPQASKIKTKTQPPRKEPPAPAADDTDIYFLSNQQKTARTVDCSFRVTGKVPELWHPDTGRIEPIAFYRQSEGQVTLPIHFDPIGSVFVVFRHASRGYDPIVALQRDGQPLATGTGIRPLTLPVFAGPKFIEVTAFEPGHYTFPTVSGKAFKADVPAIPAPLAIEGSWKLSFPPKLGAPAAADFAQLISWSQSSDPGIKYFSGTATYSKELVLPPEYAARNRRLFLDLGDVKNLAEVRINGKSLGVLWKEPYRVEITQAIKPGKNRLEIAVTNLWPNRLIGDLNQPETQRITWASVTQYNPDSPLKPSGLLGPVRIIPAQKITLGLRPAP